MAAMVMALNDAVCAAVVVQGDSSSVRAASEHDFDALPRTSPDRLVWWRVRLMRESVLGWWAVSGRRCHRRDPAALAGWYGGWQCPGCRIAAAAVDRAWARAHSAWCGWADAMAIPMRRIKRPTCAPIFMSARRSVPQVPSADRVCASPAAAQRAEQPGGHRGESPAQPVGAHGGGRVRAAHRWIWHALVRFSISPRAQQMRLERVQASISARRSEVMMKRGSASPIARRRRDRLSSVDQRRSRTRRAGVPVRAASSSTRARSMARFSTRRALRARPKTRSTRCASHQAISAAQAKPLSARSRRCRGRGGSGPLRGRAAGIRGDRPAVERCDHPAPLDRCTAERRRAALRQHREPPLRRIRSLSQKNFRPFRAPMHRQGVRFTGRGAAGQPGFAGAPRRW